MYKASAVVLQRVLLVAGLAVLTACGGGGGGSFADPSLSQSAPTTQPQLFIAGAGIKGPLAFASVKLYALDTRFEQLYEPGKPLAAATTNAYAEITGLAVPAVVAPPYVLVIDGSNAIDRNTGMAPVIHKLVTIITQESLDSRKPVYATPYTTLAYQMLRLDFQSGGSSSLPLVDRLTQFSRDTIQAIGFGMPAVIDVFTTPPIITSDATSVETQQLVVNYRAAIEALSSLLYKTSLSSNPLISTDFLMERLALDLYSDGIIDNSSDGIIIGGIDTAILSQNPMSTDIPNTDYLVSDTVRMMDEERSLIGSSSNVAFFTNDVAVTLNPALLSSRLDSSSGIGYTGSVGNISNTLLLTGLITSSPVGAEILFYQDFNNEPLHTYTINDVRTAWNNADGAPKTDAVKIVPDPDPSGSHGNTMQVFYAANKVGHGGNSGSRWQMDIGSHDELYFAYDVYFEKNAEFVRGGKLPGLSSVGVYSNAGVPSDGTDRWTGVLMWHDNGQIINYVYHANQPGKFGDNIEWDDGPNGQVYFQKGKWNRVEIHYKMNTPGILDGSLQAWFNGVKVLDTNSIMYRMPGGENLKIGTLQFLTFYGGNDISWAPSTDQHIYFDNFVVSTKPITH